MARKKSSAPRKNSSNQSLKKELRGTKMSTNRQICNVEKFESVVRMMDQVLSIKQKISTACHDNLLSLFIDPYTFKEQYKNYSNSILNAWETQALFHDIVGDYQRAIQDRFKNVSFIVQSPKGWKYETYRRSVKKNGIVLHATGEIKPGTFQIQSKKTDLTKIAKYLLSCKIGIFDIAQVENDELRNKMQFLSSNKNNIWQRLLTLVAQKQNRILEKVSCAHYTTGTHRRHPRESNSKIIYDANNTEYKYWLKIRVGNEKTKQANGKKAQTFEYLPLLFNKSRLHPNSILLDQEWRLKTNGNKIHACLTFESSKPEFKATKHVVGVDANTKHNLLADSDGRVFDYNRLWLDRMLALFAKMDQIQKVDLNHRQKSRLAKWVRANEGMLKFRIHEIMNVWEAAGVTDIVLEDLSLVRDATLIRHQDFEIKFSRLSRLLRLSNLKDFIGSQAEKRGIRVHVTYAAYSSQECPSCHHVSRNNRQTQEVFSCEDCGFTAPADNVAGMNLKHRIVSDVLKPILHEFDVFGRASPKKKMTRSQLKSILTSQLKAGPLTDLHGPALSNKLPEFTSDLQKPCPSL